MQLDNLQTLSLLALSYLIEQESLRDRFLVLTGYRGDQLAALINDQSFHEAVLGFFMQNEPDLLDLAAATDIAPELFAKAHAILSGASCVEESI